MSAIRLARGYTGRDLLIKFEGCYHGHSDSLLVKAGSGLLTFGNPSSGGVPADLAQHTLVLDYNDAEQVEQAFARHGDRIAAVIVEPVAGNMNLIAPDAVITSYSIHYTKLYEPTGGGAPTDQEKTDQPRQRARHRAPTESPDRAATTARADSAVR